MESKKERNCNSYRRKKERGGGDRVRSFSRGHLKDRNEIRLTERCERTEFKDVHVGRALAKEIKRQR